MHPRKLGNHVKRDHINWDRECWEEKFVAVRGSQARSKDSCVLGPALLQPAVQRRASRVTVPEFSLFANQMRKTAGPQEFLQLINFKLLCAFRKTKKFPELPKLMSPEPPKTGSIYIQQTFSICLSSSSKDLREYCKTVMDILATF